MKTLLLRILSLLALTFASLHAAEEKTVAEVRAADDERLAAIKAGDPARLEAILSDQLHYAHDTGVIDTKASYIKSLVSKSTVYESFDYKTRNFTVAAPGIVLMTGHVIIKVGPKGTPNTYDLNILAVWREENGRWRFLAWQSCKNPPATAATPEKM